MRTTGKFALAAAFMVAPVSGFGAPIEDRTFDCVIEARQTVKLASSAPGVIAQLNVDRGDIVVKGQILGKLDDRTELATLAVAKARANNDFDIAGHRARLDWLSKKFTRADGLARGRIVTLNTRDEDESDMNVEAQQLHLAELQHDVAALEVAQADAALAQRQFVSPIDGVVVERLLSVGEYRNDQSAVMTLAEVDPLRVEVFVPTIYYGQVRVGSVGHVRPEQPVGGNRSATVTVVDKTVDAASGTFGVRLELPNPDLTLPAGLKCNIQFERISDEVIGQIVK